jgi:hypothetical protein
VGPEFDNNSGVKYINIVRQVFAPKSSVHQESDKQKYNKSDRFADNVDVSFNPATDGNWDTISSNLYIWRLGLYSQNASSIGLIISKYQLLPGVKLFIYSPSETEISGAFTFRNNKACKLLATAPEIGRAHV